jgi:hypothetical protein
MDKNELYDLAVGRKEEKAVVFKKEIQSDSVNVRGGLKTINIQQAEEVENSQNN